MTYTPRWREYYIFFILSIHSLPISYRCFWRNFYALSIPIPLYSVRITLKDGRWMKLIRQCRDGKSEHYWPFDIINIPTDSSRCTIQKTPWLNLSIMHNPQNTSTSLFQNLPYQNCTNVFLHDLPLFVFTLCLTAHNSMNLKIDQLSYKNQMILNEMNYKN